MVDATAVGVLRIIAQGLEESQCSLAELKTPTE